MIESCRRRRGARGAAYLARAVERISLGADLRMRKVRELLPDREFGRDETENSTTKPISPHILHHV